MSNLVVANTILEQLGGRRFMAMTGANSFTGSKDSLSFRIPQRNGIRAVVVKLEPNDTYTVKFYGIVKFDCRLKAEQSNVYCDELQDVFVKQTGLAVRL